MTGRKNDLTEPGSERNVETVTEAAELKQQVIQRNQQYDAQSNGLLVRQASSNSLVKYVYLRSTAKGNCSPLCLRHAGLPEECPVGSGCQVLPIPNGQRLKELGSDLFDHLLFVDG